MELDHELSLIRASYLSYYPYYSYRYPLIPRFYPSSSYLYPYWWYWSFDSLDIKIYILEYLINIVLK